MTKIEIRKYRDHLGDEITEYTCRGMRLRTCFQNGIRVFNYQDIETLQGYEAEEVFEFLSEAMGDELFDYLVHDKGKC